MKAKLDILAFYSEDVRAVKEISLDDISSLLIRSYENTVDWIEGSTHNDAKNAIESALQGVYGEFQPEASGVLCDGEGLPVSGILCSIYENEPFVIFTFTDPRYANQGYAKKLIRHSASQFLSLGFSEIHLYVTDINPALHLYKKLGFIEQ